jgi:hypothetical protein
VAAIHLEPIASSDRRLQNRLSPSRPNWCNLALFIPLYVTRIKFPSRRSRS